MQNPIPATAAVAVPASTSDLNVEFWAGPSRPQPRRYNKSTDWQPHKSYILRKRSENVPLDEIVKLLKSERKLDVELHQLKHVLRTWNSTVRINATRRRYIVSKTLQRRAAGKQRTVFKYAETGEKIPDDKVDKVLKRYKNEAQGPNEDEQIDLIAQTPSASSVSSKTAVDEDHITPLQKAAARWLQEDSTTTPIEEAMMAMSLIGGETAIPDLYQLIDESVPEIPTETLQGADPDNPQTATPGSSARHEPANDPNSSSGAPTETRPPPEDPSVINAAMNDHVEQGQAFSLDLSAGFHQATAVLRPICTAWIERVKRNAICIMSEQPLDPEPTIEEIEKIGYTPTESIEPLPPGVCTSVLKYLDDPDPLPDRGHEMLGMDWDPVSKIYFSVLPAFWGLFAGTSAFETTKLYLDDVARIFYLPTLVTKYGPGHYFVTRAMQSFGMCLGLVCHPQVSAEILEIAVRSFDKLDMKLHQHALDTFYQLAQVLPFSPNGPLATRLVQFFHQRCLVRYGRGHGRTISALALMARLLINQNLKPIAITIINEANKTISETQESEKTSKQYADALRDLGKAEFYAGLTHKSTKTLTDALARNDDLEHRAPDSSHLSFLLGMIHGHLQQWESSIMFLRRSTFYRSDTFGELHRATGSSMEALTSMCERRGLVLYENPVLDMLEKLFKMYENRFGEDHQRTWNAWVKYGSAMMVKKITEDRNAPINRDIVEVI
ncbi:hypothetical protein TWF788_011306 [Orbilia oligospora]|uniref:Clr5 domain-containing protein n=1 Tax=Orbilia oligospora TaxID=2813651 RepID=A0A6G1M8Q9_ORBOL|nr:hypothetical protein TWF788_011306 [Orbilia oligospora]KAF3218387.1 hypothetical protein TWF679_000915 [Orbilia oligospora]KAF3219380.1 hypothetical protein TWF191_007926 [Orbilia oligospora]KAF3247374.1 hypothetical protein TWF192_006620 [Orbilia oligospora]